MPLLKINGILKDMVRALIFDIGGVITKNDFNAIYTNFARRVGIEPGAVTDYHRRNFESMLLGKDSFETFLDAMGVKEGDGIENPKEVWVEEALKTIFVDKKLLSFIDELRKKFVIATLTNLTESRLFVDERLGLYAHFDHVFLSCKEHLMKPDEAFYRLALERMNIKPNEAVFIDDKEQHVDAAKNLGIYGIVFRDTGQFKAELIKYLDHA